MKFFWNKSITRLSPAEGYRRWASSYDEERNPIKENSDRLISQWFPLVTGKKVLDAGCGPGMFCLMAEQRGAETVTGIDLSEAMLAIARTRCPRTEFFRQDVSLALLPAETYDLVICSLVLGHCADLITPLRKLGAALRTEGVLLITDFHPFLSQQHAKRTFKDPTTGKTAEIQHFTHLVSTYTSTLSEMGFTIEELSEPQWNGQPVVFGINAVRKICP